MEMANKEEFDSKDKSVGYVLCVLKKCKRLKKIRIFWSFGDDIASHDFMVLVACVAVLQAPNVALEQIIVDYVCIPNPDPD